MDSGGSIVDMKFYKDKIIACDIGILNPTNGRFGQGLIFLKDAGQKWTLSSLQSSEKLARPVEIALADINRDSRMDYLVCEFGNFTGSLSWLENTGNNKYLRHEIKALPGAIKVYVTDYNSDGLPDLWVLFAQGKEAIVLFINKETGNLQSGIY